MKKTLSIKTWLLTFFITGIAILFTMALSVFLYDSSLYYRMSDNRLIINNYRFINPGITKNADYDTVIIGSSMIQNFSMSEFREQLGENPIKLSVGAMSIEGMSLTVDQVMREGKARKLYLAIDLHQLTKDEDDLGTYATYLYDDEPLNDFRYLLGYETWMRLLPLNIGFSALDRIGYEIPTSFATRNIDDLGNWANDFVFSEALIKETYLNDGYPISAVDSDKLEDEMKANADLLLELFASLHDVELTVFFPPYSALYWHEIRKAGNFDTFMAIISYLVNEMATMENVTVFDFHGIPQIGDLNHYKDPTHYGPEINSLMVGYFQGMEKEIRPDNVDPFILELEQVIDEFEAANSDWLSMGE